SRDWSSDVCSSDLAEYHAGYGTNGEADRQAIEADLQVLLQFAAFRQLMKRLQYHSGWNQDLLWEEAALGGPIPDRQQRQGRDEWRQNSRPQLNGWARNTCLTG